MVMFLAAATSTSGLAAFRVGHQAAVPVLALKLYEKPALGSADRLPARSTAITRSLFAVEPDVSGSTITVAAPFASYNTGSLPSGGPGRTLSVPAAYAEAGIEMQTAGVTDVINTSETGANGTWSDPELHAAMVRLGALSFSRSFVA